MTPYGQERYDEFLRRLRRVIEHTLTGAVIIALIVFSVALTVWELALQASDPLHHRLAAINHVITWVFVFELIARWLVMRRRQYFLREYWLDIIAVLPVFRAFRILRAARLLRLLRLLRLFRVGRIIAQHTGSLPAMFRRIAVEHSLLLCFLVFTVIFGATAMLLAEQQSNSDLDGFDKTFWWSLYTLLAGESITEFPATLPGRIIAATVMFLGMGVFAMVTGTISAVMVERLSKIEDMPMELLDVRDHIMICGFSRKVALILDELTGVAENGEQPMVLIADAEHEPAIRELRQRYLKLVYVVGDFTRPDVLERAGAGTCETCIIVSDRSQGRNEQDADARTILAALTIEKLNAAAFTCAELNNSDYISHLERGGVDDVVIGGEHSAMLLAQAAICHGLGDVVSELLSVRRGSRFFRVAVPPALAGRSFVELLGELKTRHDCVLVGYQRDGVQHLNPGDYAAAVGDHLIVIATQPVRLG